MDESWQERDLRHKETLFKAECQSAEAEERNRLRIEFAKAALTGLISISDCKHALRVGDALDERMATRAWELADAMVKHRFDKP